MRQSQALAGGNGCAGRRRAARTVPSAMQRPEVQELPLLRLLPGRDRRVKAGHPWAFSNEIAMTPAAKALPPGALVRLEGDDGVRHGVWHFNPHSLIAARRLSRDPAAGDRRRRGSARGSRARWRCASACTPRPSTAWSMPRRMGCPAW